MKKTVTKEIFAERLRLLMDEHKETTYSMAERFGLTSPTISRYMTGQMAAKIPTIRAMAEYFQVDPVWLMGYDVPKTSEARKSAEEEAALLAALYKDADLKDIVKTYSKLSPSNKKIAKKLICSLLED